ncbi:MAG: ester cyclase [Pseudomonadota bacterium]
MFGYHTVYDPDTAPDAWTEMLVRSFYGDLWESGHVAVADVVLHPKVRFRGSIGEERRGIDGYWRYFDLIRGAFGEYQCEILSLVSNGDQAAAKMRFSGWHRREFLGFEPSKRDIAWHGAAFFQVKKRKLRDIWVLGDTDGLRAQLAAE